MKTFKEVRMFNLSTETYLARENNTQTKLGYAIKKIAQDQISKIAAEYQKSYTDLQSKMVWEKQVDFALTDKVTGAILTSPNGSARPFLFDKEGLKGVVAAEKAFIEEFNKQSEEFDNKEFDIVPYYITDLPADLTAVEKEAFTGFVIKDEIITPEVV